MIRKYIIAACMLVPCGAMAQQVWTLGECIDHAIEHNITIKRQEANVKSQEISLNSAKNTRLPGVSASAGQNFNFGRGLNIDNMYINSNTQNTGFNVGADCLHGRTDKQQYQGTQAGSAGCDDRPAVCQGEHQHAGGIGLP